MKIQFSNYTPRSNGRRNIDEAIAEVQREMDVRKRIFDKWTADGKISWMDAHDRMERIMSALKFLIAHSTMLSEQDAERNNPLPADGASEPAVSVPEWAEHTKKVLDEVSAAVAA